MSTASWSNTGSIGRTNYTCGHCGNQVGPSEGYQTRAGDSSEVIMICPTCNRPTYFGSFIEVASEGLARQRQRQFPAPTFGDDLKHLPDDIENAYREARQCTSASAFTAAVLMCRKILMNVAVDKGADEGKRFKEYIDHLESEHFVPPGSEQWLNRVRNLGNEATHKIISKSQNDAGIAMKFTTFLLHFVYELPGEVGEGASGSNCV